MATGSITAGSGRGCMAIGSVFMKPGGGAATISQVCGPGSYM
jgi:hypothetical protein